MSVDSGLVSASFRQRSKPATRIVNHKYQVYALEHLQDFAKTAVLRGCMLSAQDFHAKYITLHYV